MQSITQKKLAQIAGVSASTISKAFSGSSEISEITRNRIFSLAKEYGCFNKYHTDTYKKRIIAVISTEQKINVFSKGLEYLERKINDIGYLMVLSFANFAHKNQINLLEYFSEYAKVDGIILLSSHFDLSNSYSTPIVQILHKDRKSIYDKVISNPNMAITSAIQHFYEMGHREIGYIGEILTTSTLTVFRDSLKKFGLKVNEDFIRTSYYRHEMAGYTEMNNLISMSQRPTAIFAAYDTIAYGAIDAVLDQKMSIPEDFSIIGMNNLSNFNYNKVKLTTINEVSNAMFDVALDLLCKRMNHSTSPYQTVVFSPKLIKRDSVKNLRL